MGREPFATPSGVTRHEETGGFLDCFVSICSIDVPLATWPDPPLRVVGRLERPGEAWLCYEVSNDVQEPASVALPGAPARLKWFAEIYL